MKTKTNYYIPFVNRGPFRFVRGLLKYMFIVDGHRIDPISMMVAKTPNEYKPVVERWYYLFYNKIIPRLYRYLQNTIPRLGGLFTYMFVTRINKKFCPYFIRWHWTFCLVNATVVGELVKFAFRLEWYCNEVVVPRGDIYDATIMQLILTIIPAVHIYSLMFGLFHAVSGQYFYFPFLTENAELHIGKRPTNSIYSGGYASWQDGLIRNRDRMVAEKRKFGLPQLWWGWFGKDNYDPEITKERYRRKNYQRRLKKRRNRKFKKLFRKFKKLFLRN